MPNATVSADTWNFLKSLFSDIRKILLKRRTYLLAFFPLTGEEYTAPDYIPHTPRSIPQSDQHFRGLIEVVRDIFPMFDISTQERWCWPNMPAPDLTSPLEIHGRLLAAFASIQSESNYYRLQFVMIVIILHRFAHIVAAEWHDEPNGLPRVVPGYPYHMCVHHDKKKNEDIDVPEPGFFLEEAMFGGIIGIVFQDEREGGLPPRLLQSDLTRISFLFLHRRDGTTYRLSTSDIRRRVSSRDFSPFDTNQLERIHAPRRIEERTCAFYNGDHLSTGFPGEGGEPPDSSPSSRSGSITDLHESGPRNTSGTASEHGSGRSAGISASRHEGDDHSHPNDSPADDADPGDHGGDPPHHAPEHEQEHPDSSELDIEEVEAPAVVPPQGSKRSNRR